MKAAYNFPLRSIFNLLAVTERSTECKLDIGEGFYEEVGGKREEREEREHGVVGFCSGSCMLVNSPDNVPLMRDTRYSTRCLLNLVAAGVAVSAPDFSMGNEGFFANIFIRI